MLVEGGPATATDIGHRLGLTAAGVRRHLDALIAAGDVESTIGGSRFEQRGRGRPAKRFRLTPTGRGRLHHTYDDLAGAAMRKLRDVAGDDAVTDFAQDRIRGMVGGVDPVAPGGDGTTSPEQVERTAEQIAEALTASGFAASTERVGTGVQICQHHCPVAHVAAEFPELCEAETTMFTELLGTHVQRLATIANGDCACTTHVPLVPTAEPVARQTTTPQTVTPQTTTHQTVTPESGTHRQTSTTTDVQPTSDRGNRVEETR
ncbi:helix-turn-helix transcriptional regulator [Williamsia sterculiae]|nr:metalloregulator ArsR/SmtB family transcription factor [Williamsia sterculiae]